MKRRAHLAGTAGALGALTGCMALAELPGVGSDGPIVEREFSLIDDTDWLDDAWSSGGSAGPFPETGAAVRFRTEERRVVIEGRVASGSRSCMETRLGAATYHADSDTLQVVVVDDHVAPEDAYCTQEAVAIPYRVTIEFDRAPPETVVVVHDKDHAMTNYEETFTRGTETTATASTD